MIKKNLLDTSSTVQRLQLQQGFSCTPKTASQFQPVWSWPKFLWVREDRMIPVQVYQQVEAVRRKISCSLNPTRLLPAALVCLGTCQLDWLLIRSLNPEYFYATIMQRTKLSPRGPGQQSFPSTLYSHP